MIFLTVGTQFPFDRLVKLIDEMSGQNGFKEKIFAQIGHSSYQPRNFESVPSLESHLFAKYMREASCAIGHAGIGTITMALDYNKPLLVMPRLKKYGEAVNNHQLDIARKFEQDGYLLAAYDVGELPAKIEKLKSFVPGKRQSQAKALAERISIFLNELSKSKSN